jgi:hypothetical protein
MIGLKSSCDETGPPCLSYDSTKDTTSISSDVFYGAGPLPNLPRAYPYGLYGQTRALYLLVRLRVRPERHLAQSCAIALRSPAPERSSDLKTIFTRYSSLYTSLPCCCCSPANSDSIHYQFIYSLPELPRDIHQARAYATMRRSNVLPRPEPRAMSAKTVNKTGLDLVGPYLTPG